MLPGAVAFLLLATVVGGALTALIITAQGDGASLLLQDRYIHRVTLFTLFQALLSTLLSALFAIPVARAFYRRRFVGRAFLLRLFGLCLVVPTIAAILGIIQVHGKSGWVHRLLDMIGVDSGHYLYGLTGILIAHVFFNMPLMVRGLLNAFNAIPAESWRLARQLGMSEWQAFRLIEWPALRNSLPGLAGLVLMLCFTSFAVILTLGGGPKATTLEVAIYQSLRFDFDIARAVALAFIQIVICGGTAALMLRVGKRTDTELTHATRSQPPASGSLHSRLFDGTMIAVSLVLVLPPGIAIILGGLNSKLSAVLVDPSFHVAVLTSLAVALPAGLLALATGFAILVTSRHLGLRLKHRNLGGLLEHSGALILVVPPYVLATGLFVALRSHTDLFSIGPVLVVLINALMALPFVIRVIGPTYHRLGQEQERLCRSLGMTGWLRLHLVEWPDLRKPVALALALAVTLSLGDFGVIALFGSQDFATLPLYIYRNMGSYRMDQAAVAALALIALIFVLFQALERLIGGRNA
ncbi:thiamine/thiamine pyrophosphate ABC transporter permease [Aestuariispira ectoiniformans]|uniref:thiamine/thiamine pyrophosphate ABC transporter permease n=1 Tax=Aestuariispira ectoiniformans TaxID=2775080 RepID=UPI0021E3E036|nr:thiamine/thiamine pyrophosphate ABC transporter permease [Aestuariispira ectoiniformans]